MRNSMPDEEGSSRAAPRARAAAPAAPSVRRQTQKRRRVEPRRPEGSGEQAAGEPEQAAAQEAQQHAAVAGPAPPAAPAPAPAQPENDAQPAQEDDPRAATVKEALPVMKQQYPDLSEVELSAGLTNCWQQDLAILECAPHAPSSAACYRRCHTCCSALLRSSQVNFQSFCGMRASWQCAAFNASR